MQENQNPHDSSHYQTGSTNPPKSNGGLVALLLVAVILLTGITQVLGLMNIQLFRQLQQQKDPSMAVIFDVSEETGASAKDFPACMGLRGSAVDDFYQIYYRYPKGMYITDVDTDCNSASQGIRAGDILLTLDNIPVCDEESLARILENYRAGDTVTAVIYRDGNRHTVTIRLQAGK